MTRKFVRVDRFEITVPRRVARPSNRLLTIKVSQTNIARLFRSTAFTEVTMAVMLSTLRCMIIGNEKALAQNVTAAKTAPTTLPKVRYGHRT